MERIAMISTKQNIKATPFSPTTSLEGTIIQVSIDFALLMCAVSNDCAARITGYSSSNGFVNRGTGEIAFIHDTDKTSLEGWIGPAAADSLERAAAVLANPSE
jgi:hypothetical protein